jgi:branched-chain amino acid transport system permease protein
VTAVLLQQVVNGVVIGVVYALIAVGLTLVFGILDVINFAHGEFYMLGAFLTTASLSAWGSTTSSPSPSPCSAPRPSAS